MNLLAYAEKSTPAPLRVGAHVAHAPHLAWVFSLLHKHPTAEVALTGETVRDAIVGYVPRSTNVVIRGLDDKSLSRFLATQGDIHGVNDGHWRFSPAKNLVLDVRHPRRLLSSTHSTSYPDHTASLEDDLALADFTVNALAYSINDGQLVDPYNGLTDLRHAQLRTVQDTHRTFTHQPLAVLRALRIAAEQHFAIDNALWGTLRAHVPGLNRTTIGEGGQAEFAIERSLLGDEFLRSFTAHPSYALELWLESGALALVSPEILALGGAIDDQGKSGLTKTRQLLKTLTSETFRRLHGHSLNGTSVIAALLTGLGDRAQNALRSLTTRLHLHRAPADSGYSHTDVAWILEHLAYLDDHDPATLSTQEQNAHFAGDRGATLLAIIHALHLVDDKHTIARERVHTAKRLQTSQSAMSPLPELLRGRDLAQAGVTPGPLYRLLLKKIRTAQLSGDIATKQQAHELVQRVLASSTT